MHTIDSNTQEDGVTEKKPMVPAKRMLLIDDTADLGPLIRSAVRPLGYVCEHAMTFQAFQALLSDEFDVILVSLMMPGTDGREVLRYLAAQRHRAAILLIGGADRRVAPAAAVMAQASALNVIGCLSKPFRHGDLGAALRRAERRPANGLIQCHQRSPQNGCW